MSKKTVAILGTGAAARYVAYILSYDRSVDIVGFVSQAGTICESHVYGKPVLGDDSILSDLPNRGINHAIIGIGNPQTRSRLAVECREKGINLANAIHPSAALSTAVQVGKGVVIEAGSVLSDNPTIADNVWIGLAAMVSHDTHIGANSSIGGRAAVGADVVIGEEVMVGMGSVIQSGRSVGKCAVIGSGANVIRDVEEYAVVVGNPARQVKSRKDG